MVKNNVIMVNVAMAAEVAYSLLILIEKDMANITRYGRMFEVEEGVSCMLAKNCFGWYFTNWCGAANEAWLGGEPEYAFYQKVEDLIFNSYRFQEVLRNVG